jgi:hypothetical protein
LKPATPKGDPVKFAGNAGAGDRSIGNKGKAFPAEVIDNGKDAEAAAVIEGIA